MSKSSSLSIREIETQFHEEFRKSIPNPEESTPEEIEKTAQKIVTGMRLRRKVKATIRCSLIPPKCEIIIEF
jgi:hypothetical protein